jgi:hypothetical protein
VRIRGLGHLLCEKRAEATERGLHVLLQVFHVERAARPRILVALPLCRRVDESEYARDSRRKSARTQASANETSTRAGGRSLSRPRDAPGGMPQHRRSNAAECPLLPAQSWGWSRPWLPRTNRQRAPQAATMYPPPAAAACSIIIMRVPRLGFKVQGSGFRLIPGKTHELCDVDTAEPTPQTNPTLPAPPLESVTSRQGCLETSAGR